MVDQPSQVHGSRSSTRYQQTEGYITARQYHVCLHNNIGGHSFNIIDARINGDVFLSLDESMLKQFGVSFGFKFTVMNIMENLVCT